MSGVVQAIVGSLGGPRVTLNATYSPTSIGAGTRTAVFELQNDGDIIVNVADVGDWINPKSAAPGLYEVRATVVSGAVSTGTTGSWLALTSTRTWTVVDSTNNGSSVGCVLTIEIRNNGGAVLASSTVTMEADRIA